MRNTFGVGVMGLFLLLSTPLCAQDGTALLAYFGGKKLACTTPDAMVHEAQKNRSGHADGLVDPGCVLLPAHTFAAIDMRHAIAVPGCDDMMVYHLYVVQRGKRPHVVRRDYYVEFDDIHDVTVDDEN